MKTLETRLELSGKNVDDSELARALRPWTSWCPLLTRSVRLQTLKYVFLPETSVSSDGLQLLEKFRLQWLDLSGWKHMDAIGAFRIGLLRSLRVLNLAKTALLDDWLPCLKNLFKLDWLGLAETDVSRSAVRELRMWLPEPTIISPHGIHYGPNAGGMRFALL